jgi:energy-coupling factor transporter ATP-binding protein EcfA2
MTYSPPRLARWTITFLFLLMAVGVPVLAATVLAGALPAVRWLTALGLILYEAGVVSLARLAFPNYERRYRQYLRRQQATLNLQAVTPQGTRRLDLERLYVPLYLDVKFINQSPHTVFKLTPRHLRQGDHPIWDFVSSRSLAGQSFVVVGEPGCGKTTLLQAMAVALAARKREVPADCRGLLPVLLFLRDHAGAIRANPYLPLAQVIGEHLARRQAPAPPVGWFEQQLEEGNCLILFDGLNEISDPQLRQLIRTWVKGCLVAYPRNRFVIASRMREYRAAPFTDVLTLEVRPFGREQIGRLARQWRAARLPGAQAATEADMLAALVKGPLMALAGNPLLLTVLINLRQRRQTLPTRPVEIYAALLALAPEQRKMPAAQRQRLLQRLAYIMQCNHQLEIAPAEAASAMASLLLALDIKDPAEAVLTKLAGTTGVLVKAQAGHFRFVHLALQEYLAAAHVAENQLQAELVAQVGDLWWHETIRLYCAQTEASTVVARILSDDKASVAALVLALDCLDEVHEVRPALWAYCQSVLREVLDGNDERRKWVAEALLAARLRRLAAQGGEWARDESLITCAEYQLFLDEQRPESQYFQPDHWPGYRHPAGAGLRPVAGVRAADAAAFCEWLSERQAGEWTYRLPTAHEARGPARLAEAAAGLGYWTASPMGGRSGRPHVIYDLAWVDASRPPMILEAAVLERIQADLTRDLLRLTPNDLPRDLECDRVLSEALALSRDLDHDLGLAHDPYHDLEGAQALAHDLAGALGFDLGLDMGFEFELARDRERDMGYDLSLAREPDPGPDAENVQRLNQARDIVGHRPSVRLHPRLSALDLTNAQTLIRTLAPKLERLADADGRLAGQLEEGLEHNLNLALDRDLDRDLALALDSDRALANALALNLHRVYTLKLVRALHEIHELAQTPDHAADQEILSRIAELIQTPEADDEQTRQGLMAARDLAMPIDLHLTVALELARVHLRDRDRASRLARLLANARNLAHDRGRCRNRALTRLVFLLNALLTQPPAPASAEAAPAAADLERQQLSGRYLELYLDFATLEARVAGSLPPFEGICLMRVRA